MATVLAHRTGYVDAPQLALEKAARLGITHLEIVMRPEHAAGDVLRIIEPHGLRISTVTTEVSVAAEDYVEQFRRWAQLAEDLGALGHFMSVHAGQMPLEQVYERLRKIGDIASDKGQFIAMETHPDLCQNGDNARDTLSAVGHPAVGMNFDTANVYYYNHDVDTVAELRKVAPYVRSVHLKDTDGGFESAWFPVVGQGVVDFPGVAETLRGVGFDGPWTLEIEGTAVHSEGPDAMEKNVAESVAYLRQIGLVGD
jgi:sugar phosphate isomerase/epimerase